ncbi:uncharacterized protein PRCAT00000394001 [Priceomyces carsonii]|uniref:uncharacterized protein n=1 Tax=Priceomyces carsonii TaxID=28549 RepID=UPI002ED8D4BD|nr:unnamed protein product [Priceomyces carsonii]
MLNESSYLLSNISVQKFPRRLQRSLIVRFLFICIIGVLALQFIPHTINKHGSSIFSNEYLKKLIILRDNSHISKTVAEDIFSKVLNETNLSRDWLEEYTSKPHLAGTNYELARWTAETFDSFGLEAEIKTYYAYLNFPKEHGLHLLTNNKVKFSASLEEDEIAEDLQTKKGKTVPTFHGYSASGNVTGRFFYANYGFKEDFQKLEELGVDMKGKIGIVRYGGIYRGLKVKFAQEHGCSGVLIYSDPGDDGEFTAANGYEQYPKGPARHESSVQRGSVLYLSYGPGDPTTPGYSSNSPDVPRKDPHDTIPRIPSLPVSYRDILPILSHLNGTGLNSRTLGQSWVGGLSGYDYSVGPSPKHLTINLYNDQFYNITPIWNVFGKIKGSIDNEVVIVGNHRDAWAGSAGDPNSGSSAMLEIIRAMGVLQESGWKPLRTIIFALFDAEEVGLVGLTEWAEDVSKELQRDVVAYLNLDSAVSGTNLVMLSSPVLNDILISVAKDVEYPKGGTLYDHFINGPLRGNILILGSGSDYTAFLEHLGIPSFDMSFASANGIDPVYHYHSNYDLFHWMEKFVDPEFKYHNTMSKFLGLITLRLADHEVIKFNVSNYSAAIQDHFNSAVKGIPKKWFKKNITITNFDDIENVAINEVESLYSATSTDFFQEFSNWILLFSSSDMAMMKNKKYMNHRSRKFKVTLEYLVNFTNHTINNFHAHAVKFDEDSRELQHELDKAESFWKKIKLYARLLLRNRQLKFLERNFLYDGGLNDRSWFKHIVYSSGRYTGYEGQALPGLQEAIEDRDFKDTEKWITILWKAITRVTFLIAL